MAEISAHERECALRYQGIETSNRVQSDAIKAQAKATEKLQGWIIATFITVFLGAVAMIGYLLVNPVILTHPSSAQTQQTQVTVRSSQ